MNDWHVKIGIERPEGQHPGDIRDMNLLRQEIYKAMRDSTLVRNVMYAADHEGMSGEDRYTLLAYEALVALETNWKQVMRARMLDPMPPMIVPTTANLCKHKGCKLSTGYGGEYCDEHL